MEFEWDENKNKSNLEKHGVDFNNEKIGFKHVSLLNRHGIIVPEEFIYYTDDDIDFSDDPDITEEDFSTGKLIWNVKTSLLLTRNLKIG